MLLAMEMFAPGSARAGCGNHVFSDVNRSALESLSVLELLDQPVDGIPHREVPCSGPSCSNRQGIPSVPTTLPPVQSDQWCCTSIIPPLSGLDLSGHLADTVSRRPLHSPCSIERPPRIPS